MPASPSHMSFLPRKDEFYLPMAYMSLAKKSQNIYHEKYPQNFSLPNQPWVPNLGVGYYLAKLAP